MKLSLRITEKTGAGDGDRTRNIQLGNQNYRSFIFTTYKTVEKKSTCMQRILCMQCLICVSLGDGWGTMFLVLVEQSTLLIKRLDRWMR